MARNLIIAGTTASIMRLSTGEPHQ